MKYRKLRFAWSAVCGIFCLLLILLWMRSYSYIDTVICYRGGNWYGIDSRPGCLRFHYMDNVGVSDGWFLRGGMPVEDEYPQIIFRSIGSLRISFQVLCAHWLFAIFFAAVSAGPWLGQMRWRFSLCALLIAMKLVVFVLALIMALPR
jgi:hypothetical protein